MKALNRFGVFINATLIAILFVGIALRTNFQNISSVSDWGILIGLVVWAAVPYAAMVIAHLRSQRLNSAALVVGTMLIAIFGIHFLVDAFWTNFSSNTAGLPLVFMPLYQIPVCFVTVIAAKFWRDREQAKGK